MSTVSTPVEKTILVSLDAGKTFIPAANGVQIVFKGVIIDGEDGRGELHLNVSNCRITTDIWTTREEPLDHNIGSDRVDIDDIVARLVSEND